MDIGQKLSLTSADETAVQAVVSEFANTWNRHDMKRMHELNTENVEWINITGNHWRGNATVYKGHDTIHRTIFSKTQMSIESTVIRSIAPGVVVAVATMKFGPVTAPTGEQIPELKTRGSFTLVKTDDTWIIAHFHNTSVDPIAEQHDPVTWDDTGFLPGKPPT
ncbi:MAG: SgcJ/EcaC family oxidoreductase [Nitrospira sp.]|nr:SgcJ/EcaC family oxidoreductase [Nitrospira sp.]